MERRVLLLAPHGRDAAVISDLLTKTNFANAICRDVLALTAAIDEGAAAAIVAEEALQAQHLDALH